MPKLQKRPPPAYPGSSTSTTTLEDALQYENLRQDTRQPIPLTSNNHETAISGALEENQTQPAQIQAHSRRAVSEQLSAPPHAVMDASKGHRPSNTTGQIHAPQPQRRSVELRRLDGRPYEQKQKYMVAQDMHDGELPPAYKRQASDPIDPAEVAQAIGNPPSAVSSHHGCTKCGRQRRPSATSPSDHSCTKCGKQKSTSNAGTTQPTNIGVASPPPLTALPAIPTIAPVATAPLSTAPVVTAPARKMVASSPTEAGPSSKPSGHRHCHKCGRPKKPATAPLPQSVPDSIQPPPHSAPLPNQGPSRISRAGLSITPASNISQGITPLIDIVPPSASTYQPARDSTFSTGTREDAPLVAKGSKKAYDHFRNNSIVRSLSRHKSNRSNKDKRVSVDSPSPHQEASQADGADLGAGRLINLISSAIKDDSKPDYQRLSVTEQISRPSSPFSFMETTKDDQAFEMVPLADKDANSPVSSPRADAKSPDSITSPRPRAERLDVPADRRSRSMEVPQKQDSLSVPHDRSRPPITRFKSLREGVSRAASVSRQTSLRRLESLKKVPQFWESDGMALEGGENLAVY